MDKKCALHEARITKMEARLEAGNVHLESINKNLEKLNKVLIDGNGRPSLVTRHELLASQISDHMDSHEKANNNTKWTITQIIVILVSVATLVVAIKYG